MFFQPQLVHFLVKVQTSTIERTRGHLKTLDSIAGKSTCYIMGVSRNFRAIYDKAMLDIPPNYSSLAKVIAAGSLAFMANRKSQWPIRMLSFALTAGGAAAFVYPERTNMAMKYVSIEFDNHFPGSAIVNGKLADYYWSGVGVLARSWVAFDGRFRHGQQDLPFSE